MEKRKLIDGFLNSSTFAVAGVSRNQNKFGSVIYREMNKRGLKLYPVNPSLDNFEGDKCYPSLTALPEKPEGVIVVTPPSAAESVVKDAWEAGIKKVWLQQGAQSDEAVAFCKEKGMDLVSKECIFMYWEPVRSIHRFHRGIAKIFGKYHKLES